MNSIVVGSAIGRIVNDLTYLAPTSEKRQSPLHGAGLFAGQDIRRDELVAVKGGYILTTAQWAELEPVVGLAAEVPVSTDLVIAPRSAAEYPGSMMHLNHACDPNVGVEGQIVFVAFRDIAALSQDHHWKGLAARGAAAALPRLFFVLSRAKDCKRKSA